MLEDKSAGCCRQWRPLVVVALLGKARQRKGVACWSIARSRIRWQWILARRTIAVLKDYKGEGLACRLLGRHVVRQQSGLQGYLCKCLQGKGTSSLHANIACFVRRRKANWSSIPNYKNSVLLLP